MSSWVTSISGPYTVFISSAKAERRVCSPRTWQYPDDPGEDDECDRASRRTLDGGVPGTPCDMSSKGRVFVGLYPTPHDFACGILRHVFSQISFYVKALDASTHGGDIVLKTPRDNRKDNEDDISNDLSYGGISPLFPIFGAMNRIRDVVGQVSQGEHGKNGHIKLQLPPSQHPPLWRPVSYSPRSNAR